MPRVFAVGDLILDRYVEGFADHLAPDAPVPVLVERSVYYRPGGLWNVALNLRASGSATWAFGVAGDDGVLDAVEGKFFPDGTTITHRYPERHTHVKTRFLGQYQQQMLRVDVPKDGPIDPDMESAILSSMIEVADRFGLPDAIFFADYGCGVITEGLFLALRTRFPDALWFVDPYPTSDPRIYEGADILKLNRYERMILQEKLDRYHLDLLDLCSLLVETRGKDSVIAQARDRSDVLVEVPPRDLVDPCGAGDTFAAYLLTTLLQDRPLVEALNVAAHAGACAVARRGVCVVTVDEVMRSLTGSASAQV